MYHWELDVRCSMFGVLCSMFGVLCWMFGVRCSMFDVRCSMFGVLCSMFDVRCSVFGVLCSMFDVRYLCIVPGHSHRVPGRSADTFGPSVTAKKTSSNEASTWTVACAR